MKTYLKIFSIAAILLFSAATSFSTPLSGTYTVGSGGDYSTINSAFSDAALQGIVGPVIFEVMPGIYNEEVGIAVIPGSSSINTVTLTSQSGNAADVTVNGISSVVRINSNNIIIDKITLGTCASVKALFSGANISFTNNDFTSGDLQIVQFVYSSGILLSGNRNIRNINFQGMDFGYWIDNLRLINNHISGFVLLIYCSNVLIEGNKFLGGIETIYSFNQSLYRNVISGQISIGGYYMINNFFLNVTGEVFGNYIANNTIAGGNANVPAINCNVNIFINNILINTGGGYAFSGQFNYGDHNNYYNGSDLNLIKFAGITYNSVIDFYNHTGFDEHSNSHPVNFVSPADLHLASSSLGDDQLLGIPDTLVTVDIDGQPRDPVNPYKGADEAVDYPLPVELVSFTSSVNNNNVTLHWTTSSEVNNAGFDIERSEFNIQFPYTNVIWVKAGTVSGQGTSSSINNYEFTDKDLSAGIYKYRLKQTDYNGNTEYYNLSGEIEIGDPVRFKLSQNYPNPFNPFTNIEYWIPEQGFVTLKVYDISGKEVQALVNEMLSPGYYKVKFDGSDLASGIYFYQLKSGDFLGLKRMMILK